MLGWDFFIYPERVQAEATPESPECLGAWQSAHGGIDWLEDLCALDQASKSGDGYPFLFRLSAETLINVLKRGIPNPSGPLVIGDDYVLSGDWLKVDTIRMDALQKIDPGEMLVVEVWDRS